MTLKRSQKEIIKSLIEEFDGGEVTWELRDRAVNLWRFFIIAANKNISET